MDSETGASGSLWSPSRTYRPASGSVASSGPFVRRPRKNVRTGVASTPRETSPSSVSRLDFCQLSTSHAGADSIRWYQPHSNASDVTASRSAATRTSAMVMLATLVLAERSVRLVWPMKTSLMPA